MGVWVSPLFTGEKLQNFLFHSLSWNIRGLGLPLVLWPLSPVSPYPFGTSTCLPHVPGAYITLSLWSLISLCPYDPPHIPMPGSPSASFPLALSSDPLLWGLQMGREKDHSHFPLSLPSSGTYTWIGWTVVVGGTAAALCTNNDRTSRREEPLQ